MLHSSESPPLSTVLMSLLQDLVEEDSDIILILDDYHAISDQAIVDSMRFLLDQLLVEIGMQRSEVFICNTLKCRPPGNRDPLPVEIENCQEYLLRQVELIEPKVICTLGNFSTKLLRRDPTGITRLHGQSEVITLGRRAVRLYPIYHPAAALYTPRMLQTLREDFAHLPELLAMPAPEQPPAESFDATELTVADGEAPASGGEDEQPAPQPDQLGLF